MTIYNSNYFRSGLKIIFDKEPYVIESSQFIKPGKGQSFVRVKLRRLLTGKLIDKTFKATETLQSADIIEVAASYLYNNRKFWFFINKKTFEEISAKEEVLKDVKKWLVDLTNCTLMLWNNEVISVTLSNFVELKVIETSPSLKGDSIGTTTKKAKLITGASIRVPLFIKEGEIIKVDTRSGEYVARVR
ncbi:elongation factor P [Buchnera aphidicola (Mindarus keteleerifoliae)]|uniref:elongation factor P n=1 Tax=Buchnera aphidicola TaxID=9 RepID=UPI0031B6E24D